MAVLLGVIASLGFGINDYLAGLAARRVSAFTVTFWVYAIELPFFAVVAVVVGDPIDTYGVVLGMLAGIAAAVGLVLFYRAMAIGRFSVVAAISGGLTAALPAAIGYVQGDRIPLVSVCGVIAMAVGIVVVTAYERPPEIPEVETEHARHRQPRGLFGPDVVLAVIAGLCFVATFVWLDAARARTGQWTLLSSSVVPLLGLGVALLVRRTSFALGPATGIVVGGAVLNAGAGLALVGAFGAGTLGVASASASFYPVITGICAFVFLKERVRVPQAFGLAAAALALALLAVGEVH